MPLHHNNYINTNTDSTMVSYYDHEQEYKSHKDSTQFTFLVWLYKEPKKFKGGDFCLTEANKRIKCIPNRMVMFPSYLGHKVYPVRMDSDAKFGDGRYCVTHFFNWEAKMKEVKNIIVPCWVYENDQGIPHDVCDYFVNKYQNTKTTSGKTDGKNKELIDKKVRDVKR